MKCFKNLQFLLLCCIILSALPAAAQINMPQASPLSTSKQTVGLAEVTITYSRPSMKGRKIFGELVPYEQLWRTGANTATQLSFSKAVSIDGKTLPAGSYALFSIPGKQEWTLILNKNTQQGGTADYKESEDALRIKAKAEKTAQPWETFTLLLSDVSNEQATLHIYWENTRVGFTIKDPDVEQQVMAQIQEQMKNPGNNAGLYFQAASYYFEKNKDLKQAQQWIDQAIALDGDKFWMLHMQAKIHAKSKNKDKAVAAARKSMKLAEENGNMDYVKLNQQLIDSL